MNVNKSPSQATDTVADQAAQGAESAIKATQRAAHETIDQLSEKASEMRDRAAPIINRVATQAEELAKRRGARFDLWYGVRSLAYPSEDRTLIGPLREEWTSEGLAGKASWQGVYAKLHRAFGQFGSTAEASRTLTRNADWIPEQSYHGSVK